MDGKDHKTSYTLKVDGEMVDKYRTKAGALRRGYDVLWKKEIGNMDCEDLTFMEKMTSKLDPKGILIEKITRSQGLT